MMMDGFVYTNFVEQDEPVRKRLYKQSYDALKHLKLEYPDFDNWYKNLFINDCTLANDRDMLLCLYGCNIAGISVLKFSENKICTLYVVDMYRR